MSWQESLENNITNPKELYKFFRLPLSEEKLELQQRITDNFPMSIPEYYLKLIDRDNPDDPIRKQCIPSFDEIDLSGLADSSGEMDNTVFKGLQHKYAQTALILTTNNCAMYCRHCFRKRMVGSNENEVAQQIEKISEYVESHTEITNVLMSGGDSFLISNEVMEDYLRRLTEIKHLDFIRFGTRTPVVFPQRVNDDPELLEILTRFTKKKQIMVVVQYNHPGEFTAESVEAIHKLQKTGVVVKNQSVLLKGVNDNPEVISSLLRQLTKIGIVPYYIFQCRPVMAVQKQFQVPLSRGLSIVEEAKKYQNGQGKCFRYSMSHPTGKIELIGRLTPERMVFKYAQAKNPQDNGRIFEMEIDDSVCWLKDIPTT